MCMRKSSLFLALIGLLTGLSLHGATTTYIDFGAPWRYKLGTNEASSPDITAWRQLGFDDSSWSGPAATPIGYGDPVPATIIPGSSAIVPNWLSIFMRKTFVVNSISDFTNLNFEINIDDGYVAWINGIEVGRDNMPGLPGDPVTTNTA